MIIFPAIDIKDGKVVRLFQGKFDKVSEYSDDPVSVAKDWEAQGAQWLHIVDLDGAKSGKLQNAEIIIKIAKAIKIPIQMGGGIRSIEDVKYLTQNGVARVILGTKAVQDTDFLIQLIDTYHEKIAVSIDASMGFVTQRGWQELSTILATDWAKRIERCGVSTIIYTDVATDGMLSGPNIKELKEILSATKMSVIASGGISCIKDIADLLALDNKQLIGAITGRAIYEGKLDLKEALKLCSQNG